MKDLFSGHSAAYAQYRPGYPQELFAYLRKLCASRERAWDCGTGNGQVAGELANFFEQVYATDISINQISQAIQKPNIHYTKQAAENTNFSHAYFDLVTVGQAVHWFDFTSFYSEIKRVLKKDAVIALFGYGLVRSDLATNKIIDHLYNELVGKYWAAERCYIKEAYKSILFPFEEIEVPEFKIEQHWSFERLIGYLNTWSAVKAYEQETGKNPVAALKGDLQRTFGEVGSLNFPVFARIGRNS